MCHIILMMPILALPLFWVLPLSIAAPVYGVILLLSSWLYYFTMQAMRRPTEIGSETMIGHMGEVVDVAEDAIWVRVQNENWKAECSEPLHTGDTVKVTARNGLILQVSRHNSLSDIAHEAPAGNTSHAAR